MTRLDPAFATAWGTAARRAPTAGTDLTGLSPIRAAEVEAVEHMRVGIAQCMAAECARQDRERRGLV